MKKMRNIFAAAMALVMAATRLHHTAGSRNRTDKYSSDRRTKHADSIAAGRFPV